MTTVPPVEAPVPRLAEGLRRGLPGLSAALDEERAAEQVQGLLACGTEVARVSVGKVWLREDGTCTLRYDLRLGADGGGASRLRTVLGRVHPDDDAAVRYVAARVLPIARRSPPSAMPPWRRWAVVVPGTGIALHPFPLDPDLPTLGAAMDSASVQRLLPGAGRLDVEVVHHAREGACVLRYRTTPATAGSSRSLYGKVYGDDATGRRVCGWLRALRNADLHVTQTGVRLPVPLSYDPALRLLVTQALPGPLRLPGMVSDVLASPRETAGTGAVLAAVRRCGRALASLHRAPRIVAPHHGPDQEIASLRRELRVVAAEWPDRADRVRRCAALHLGDAPQAPEPVLCHGDFTPSQVLLGEGTCAVTDLDGLCRAEPALDVGRFLASLALLAAKTPGPAAASLTRELTEVFLGGYRSDGAAGGPDVGDPAARLHFYRRVSLARSALHACRQLKDDRFARAVALLECDDGAHE